MLFSIFQIRKYERKSLRLSGKSSGLWAKRIFVCCYVSIAVAVAVFLRLIKIQIFSEISRLPFFFFFNSIIFWCSFFLFAILETIFLCFVQKPMSRRKKTEKNLQSHENWNIKCRKSVCDWCSISLYEHSHLHHIFSLLFGNINVWISYCERWIIKFMIIYIWMMKWVFDFARVYTTHWLFIGI